SLMRWHINRIAESLALEAINSANASPSVRSMTSFSTTACSFSLFPTPQEEKNNKQIHTNALKTILLFCIMNSHSFISFSESLHSNATNMAVRCLRVGSYGKHLPRHAVPNILHRIAVIFTLKRKNTLF